MATTYCFGQSVSLTGLVRNEQGLPLPNVSITLKAGVIIKTFTVSNNNGAFSLNVLPNQNYTISLTCVGYEPTTEPLMVESATNRNFILRIRTSVEDTVRLTPRIGIYERGDTIFYNADVFKRNNENNLADLLKNTPGFRVMPNGKLMIGDEMIGKVLLEGKDVTGENYEKIVNNLSPHNIDQIQVLKKYKDPFDLSKSATGDSEYALNITFKKKRIIPTAKIYLSAGLPPKYYEYKTDFLVLTKPITAINFANINTVGRTAQIISSPNSLFGNYTPDVFAKLSKGLPYQNSVPEIFLKLSKQDYSFNNTKYFDNSSQFNIGKKVTNKFSINYTQEKIEQSQQSSNTTFLDSQILAQTNSLNNPIIRRTDFSIKNELIWMLQKNEQIKWNFSTLKETENSINNSLLNSNAVTFKNQNQQWFANSLLSYTKFLRNATVINIAGFFDTQTNNEQLENDGVIYQNDIIPASLGAVKAIVQTTNTNERNYGSYIKLIKRKRDFSFTFQPTWKRIDGKVTSQLSAQTIANTSFSNIDSFRNDKGYTQDWWSFPVRYKYDNVKFAIDASLEPIYLQSTVFQINDNISALNGRINSNYQFRNKRRLSISISRRNEFTYLSKLRENSIIVDNKNKFLSTNFLLTDKLYSAFLNFNKFSPTSKLSVLNYTLSANLNTPNYILNSTNNNFYSVQNYVNGRITNRGMSAAIRNTTSSIKLKSRLENSLTYSSRKSNNSQNKIVFTSINNTISLDSKVSSTFAGVFNFQFSNVLSYGTSKRIGSSINNKNLSDVAGIDLNFNYRKKSHLDIEARNYFFNTFNNPSQNVFLLNASYKQLIKSNKIRLSAELRNLTNKTAFVSQNLTVTQFSQSSVLLLPRFALLKVEFLL